MAGQAASGTEDPVLTGWRIRPGASVTGDRTPAGVPAASLQAPLWRSIAAFRFASVGYAAILLIVRHANYSHWGRAWFVLGAMTAWTIVSAIAYSKPARRTRALLGADLLVTA